MRSIWKGALSFGLVTIPVKIYGATQQNDVTFHQVHAADGGRIRYRRVCEEDGEEVTYQDIAKGYELPTGETVVLTDEDFEDLPLPTGKTVDVQQFVAAADIDPIYFARSYYLEPDMHGTKPYVLLRQALSDSDRVAIVKVALRNRESLATLRVRDGVLVLETMYWPDEIRSPDFAFLNEDVEVRAQELKMAESLIDTMTEAFDPDQFTDEYREALEAVVRAKIDGNEVIAPKVVEDRGGEVVDLMAALEASVESARQQRGSGGMPSRPARAAKAAGSGASGRKSAKSPAKATATSSSKASGKASAKTPGTAPAKKTAGNAAAKKTATAKKPAQGARAGRGRAKKSA